MSSYDHSDRRHQALDEMKSDMKRWKHNDDNENDREHHRYRGDRDHDRDNSRGQESREDQQEVRRKKREQLYKDTSVRVWPPSPNPIIPSSEDEDFPSKKDDKHKPTKPTKAAAADSSSSSSSESSSDSSDSENESDDSRAGRKSSKSKKARKAKKSKKSSKKSKKSRKGRKDDGEADADDERFFAAQPQAGDDDYLEVTPDLVHSVLGNGVMPAPETTESGDIGPEPPKVVQLSAKDFGRALLAGEGAAMAEFVNDGKRIPRRGEIGLGPDQITSYEDQGFVMSGSRHRRMEAVRLRKENQIYSADERRAMLLFNQDERQKRETKIRGDFRELVVKKVEK